MPNYVRRYAPGGTFFFTVVTHNRQSLFSSSQARCPHKWPHSSFARWVNEGYYSQDWLCDCGGRAPAVPDNLRGSPTFGE